VRHPENWRSALAGASLLAGSVVACSSDGCGEPRSDDPNLVQFEANVVAVADDGTVDLDVASVSPRNTVRTDPTVYGVPHDTFPPALDTVVAGTTVAVVFPEVQVEHLRRDIDERYRVVAWADGETGALTTKLDDIHFPCSPTKLADDARR
jgi:hypothetical protein